MKLSQNLVHAGVGWIAGMLTVLGLTLMWPIIFPGFVQASHYDVPQNNYAFVIGTVALIATPLALLGGFIGGRLTREGGRTEQRIVAALVGAVFVSPLVCISLWLYSGY